MSRVPASCFYICFISCPCLVWLCVHSCPAVFVSLSMIVLCIYSPVWSVWFGLVYSSLPGVPVCVCLAWPCLAWHIKDSLFELHPRLCVPWSSCVHRDSSIIFDLSLYYHLFIINFKVLISFQNKLQMNENCIIFFYNVFLFRSNCLMNFIKVMTSLLSFWSIHAFLCWIKVLFIFTIKNNRNNLI